MKLGNREKMMIAGVGAIIAVFLADRIVVAPVVARLKTIDSQIDAEEIRYEKLFSINLGKDEIASAFESIKPYIEIAKTEEGTLSAIMKKVEEMASGSEVTVLNMKPDMTPVVSKPEYIIKKTAMNVEGDQKSIIKFLYVLENSNYPIAVERLDFKVKDKERSVMEAELEVQFLYFL